MNGKKEENPLAYRLAQHLVSRCATRLQPLITQFLVDKQSDSELRKKEHELIFELNRISNTLLLKVMPLLQSELMVYNQSSYFIISWLGR